MSLFEKLAEKHIKAAMKRGDFDDLPGQGKPLALDDDSAVPEDLRAGYRILKNAGYLPRELQLRQEIRRIADLLQHVDTECERKKLLVKISLLKSRL